MTKSKPNECMACPSYDYGEGCHKPIIIYKGEEHTCPCSICLVKVTCRDFGCQDYTDYHNIVSMEGLQRLLDNEKAKNRGRHLIEEEEWQL